MRGEGREEGKEGTWSLDAGEWRGSEGARSERVSSWHAWPPLWSAGAFLDACA